MSLVYNHCKLLIIPYFLTERKGIGTGWFYSVLGGGLTKDPNTGAITNLRPTNNVEHVPLSFDNTAERRMRGDFAIPTLFGGNFDAVFNPQQKSIGDTWDSLPWKSNPPPPPEDPTDPEEESEELESE